MKTVEELKISPMPWAWSEERDGMIVDANCHDVALVCYESERNIIKSAPELYECLAQAVAFISDNAEFLGSDCITSEFVEKCRRALAKAGGEEATE